MSSLSQVSQRRSRSVPGFILLEDDEFEWVRSGKPNDDKVDGSAGCVPLKRLA
jgi:hypothetical protein